MGNSPHDKMLETLIPYFKTLTALDLLGFYIQCKMPQRTGAPLDDMPPHIFVEFKNLDKWIDKQNTEFLLSEATKGPDDE